MSKTKSEASKTTIDYKYKVSLIAVSIIAVAAIVIAVVIYFNQSKDNVKVEPASRGTLVTPDNVQNLVAQSKETVEDGYYTTSMNVDWTFDNGKAKSKDAYVENDISNTRTVYFDLLMADSGEMLYTSPYIPVGSTLKDFALAKEMPAGDYDAVVQYHLVDNENNEISTVSVAVKLHILK